MCRRRRSGAAAENGSSRKFEMIRTVFAAGLMVAAAWLPDGRREDGGTSSSRTSSNWAACLPTRWCRRCTSRPRRWARSARSATCRCKMEADDKGREEDGARDDAHAGGDQQDQLPRPKAGDPGYSCHRGAQRPVNTPAVPLVVGLDAARGGRHGWARRPHQGNRSTGGSDSREVRERGGGSRRDP